jgi:hypothetical protein
MRWRSLMPYRSISSPTTNILSNWPFAYALFVSSIALCVDVFGGLNDVVVMNAMEQVMTGAELSAIPILEVFNTVFSYYYIGVLETTLHSVLTLSRFLLFCWIILD